mgnify:CR=1 FL=1
MQKLSSYLLVIFMIMYWVLRIIITLSAQLGGDFVGVVPINMTFEIILLFAFLLCVILVIKRKVIGATLYLALYGIYFGGDLTEKLRIITSGETLTMDQMACGFFSLIGIILALAVLIDLLFDKGRKIHPVDKKTDWFYKNEQFDRELDDRADKNNYRTL